MTRTLVKAKRVAWRIARNLVCAVPGGARILFPASKLASIFGRGDAAYALQVFRHHHSQLHARGFSSANSILEVGPGRNLGTSLLWWAAMVAKGEPAVRVTLWDVHPNANPFSAGYWPAMAQDLLNAIGNEAASEGGATRRHSDVLVSVASGNTQPDIRYVVCRLTHMEGRVRERPFGLIYSHAALEHVWAIDRFWAMAGRLTGPNGWHSHRIDLADHGQREANYLEMLEWSRVSWWLTMRFLPGAINRWRASDHESAVRNAGLHILQAKRELRDKLPVPRWYLSKPFRSVSEEELRATAIDIVARCE